MKNIIKKLTISIIFATIMFSVFIIGNVKAASYQVSGYKPQNSEMLKILHKGNTLYPIFCIEHGKEWAKEHKYKPVGTEERLDDLYSYALWYYYTDNGKNENEAVILTEAYGAKMEVVQKILWKYYASNSDVKLQVADAKYGEQNKSEANGFFLKENPTPIPTAGKLEVDAKDELEKRPAPKKVGDEWLIGPYWLTVKNGEIEIKDVTITYNGGKTVPGIPSWGNRVNRTNLKFKSTDEMPIPMYFKFNSTDTTMQVEEIKIKTTSTKISATIEKYEHGCTNGCTKNSNLLQILATVKFDKKPTEQDLVMKFETKKNPTLEIFKYEKGNINKPLKDAKFRVEVIEPSYVHYNDVLTTDVNGKILLPGELAQDIYKIRVTEIEAPLGYIIKSPSGTLGVEITFGVDENGKAYFIPPITDLVKVITDDYEGTAIPALIYDEANNRLILEWPNEQMDSSGFRIRKVDDKGKALPGVSFSVLMTSFPAGAYSSLDEYAAVLGMKQTGQDGIIEIYDLKFAKPGDYVFRITEVRPNGYKLPDGTLANQLVFSLTVTVDAAGKITKAVVDKTCGGNISVSIVNGIVELRIVNIEDVPEEEEPTPGSISGYVWEDEGTGKTSNHDGRFADGEKGIKDVEVELWLEKGDINTGKDLCVKTTKTNSSGYYSFIVTPEDCKINPTSSVIPRQGVSGPREVEDAHMDTPGKNIFYVVIKYNGLEYTITKKEEGDELNSKAVEDSARRRALAEYFGEVGPDKGSIRPTGNAANYSSETLITASASETMKDPNLQTATHPDTKYVYYKKAKYVSSTNYELNGTHPHQNMPGVEEPSRIWFKNGDSHRHVYPRYTPGHRETCPADHYCSGRNCYCPGRHSCPDRNCRCSIHGDADNCPTGCTGTRSCQRDHRCSGCTCQEDHYCDYRDCSCSGHYCEYDIYEFEKWDYFIDTEKGEPAVVGNASKQDPHKNIPYNSRLEDVSYTNVNFGLLKRDQLDLELMKDLKSVTLQINGETKVFTTDGVYDNTGNSSYGTVDPVVGEDIRSTETEDEFFRRDDLYKANINIGEIVYNRPILPSDYTYRDDKVVQDKYGNSYIINDNNEHTRELKVYVDYKIIVRNNSPRLLASVTELVDYYSDTLTPVKAYTDSNPQGIRLTGNSIGGGYGKTYINTPEMANTVLSSGSMYTLYVQFEVNKNDVVNRSIQLGQKANVVEINRYRTGPTMNGSIMSGQVDRDSIPGNYVPAIPAKNGANYEEDDTYAAPIVELNLHSDETGRKISGKVWDDTNNPNGKEDIGEPDIAGVRVELVEKVNNADGEFIWPAKVRADGTFEYTKFEANVVTYDLDGSLKETTSKSVTVQNDIYSGYPEEDAGKYNFSGFIPGNYEIRFIYGSIDKNNKPEYINGKDAELKAVYGNNANKSDMSGCSDTYIAKMINAAANFGGVKNSLPYTGQDYESTVLGTQSKATDSANRREDVIRFSQKIDNNMGNLLALTDSDRVAELLLGTWMKAGIDNVNIPVGQKELINQGLGLKERPKTQVGINKEIDSLKLKLNDGTVVAEANLTLDDGSSILKNVAESIVKIPDNNRYEQRGDINVNKEGTARFIDVLNVHLQIEEILLEGAQLEIVYAVTFYNDGNVPTRITKAVDYVDNDLKFVAKETINESNGWIDRTVDSDYIKNNGRSLIEQSLLDAGIEQKLLAIMDIENTKIEDFKKFLNRGDEVISQIYLSKTLNRADTSDDMAYYNVAEILEYENVLGRRNYYGIPGNQRPHEVNGSTVPGEEDIGMSAVRITPPLGDSTEHNNTIIYILAIIVGTILLAGITLIGIKVLKKK